MLCQWGTGWEVGTEHGQDIWSEWAKGLFYTVEHRAQYMNQGELAGRGGPTVLWGGPGLVVSNRILGHLFLPSFIPLSLSVPFSFLLLLLLLIIIFYFNYQTILVLTYKHYFFFFSGGEDGVNKQLSGS